jgi:hypothetical protein
MISVELVGHLNSMYMIFSFMLQMTSLTSYFAWNVSILILTRFIAQSVDNALILNGRKIQDMIICRDRLPSHVPELRLNGDLVVYTNKVRNLGMIVNDRFSFHDQAYDIQRR